jgi:cytochrome c551/c552
MRIRIVTILSLMLASSGCAGAGGQSAQSQAESRPKAVRGQMAGKAPDYAGQNQSCLGCHEYILEMKTPRRADVPNLHLVHLESKNMAYQGSNRGCVTCHEMMTPTDKRSKKEGWILRGNVYHPDSTRDPKGVWRKLIVAPGISPKRAYVDALQPAGPYIYKPTLKRLVCLDCHGPDSKIKVIYGAGALQAMK